MNTPLKTGTTLLITGILLLGWDAFHSEGTARLRADKIVAMRIDFDSLDKWAPYTFDSVPKATDYQLTHVDGVSALAADSKGSASVLSHTMLFDAHKFPKVRWRWRVDNLYSKADPYTVQGDDFPLRIFILFKFDREKANFLERMIADSIDSDFGEWLPERWLSYVWSSTEHQEFSIVSPYTERSHRVLVRQGADQLGQWVEEEVNVFDDFVRVFGKEPPKEAWIAIMSDSDDTGEQTRAYIDFIEIFASGEKT